MKIRVLIVEDDALIRSALCLLVNSFRGMAVTGEASNGIEAVRLAARAEADVILMDLVMPQMDGIEASRAIKDKTPGQKILALTAFGERQQAVEALDAGVDGIVLKKVSSEELQQAITTVVNGGRHMCQQISERLKNDVQKDRAHTLSRRQQQVLELMIAGERTKAISETLGLSPRTIEKYRDNVRRKYGVNTVTELVARFLEEMKAGK